jgi:hypothetical protein
MVGRNVKRVKGTEKEELSTVRRELSTEKMSTEKKELSTEKMRMKQPEGDSPSSTNHSHLMIVWYCYSLARG